MYKIKKKTIMPTIIPLDFEKEIREFRGQLQALKLPPINPVEWV